MLWMAHAYKIVYQVGPAHAHMNVPHGLVISVGGKLVQPLQPIAKLCGHYHDSPFPGLSDLEQQMTQPRDKSSHFLLAFILTP